MLRHYKGAGCAGEEIWKKAGGKEKSTSERGRR